MKWKRVLAGKVYCDADRKFVIEFMAGSYWLATAAQGSDGLRSAASLGRYRTCREARKAAERYLAGPPITPAAGPAP